MPFNGARIINFKKRRNVFTQRHFRYTFLPDCGEMQWENGIGIVTYDEKEVIAGTELDKYILLKQK